MKTAFLTGTTGFVGSHTAARYLAEGWHVRALVRNPSRPGRLPPGCEAVEGTLDDAHKYRSALAGCDAVIHVAGVVKARTLAEYQHANATGTEVLAKAAQDVCPNARFVLVSSQAAAGPARDGRALSESDPPQPVSWYGRSKLEGERALQRSFTGQWCVIRPVIVYGAGDPGVLELFKTVQSGWAPILAGGRTRVQLIAVNDLARILFAATNHLELSHRQAFAATDTVTTRELITEIASLRAKRPRFIPVPAWAIRCAGALESFRQWVTRQPRPFNLDKAREILQPDWLCDGAPLLRDLALSDLTPWRQGLRDVCRWYVDANWLMPTIWAV